MKYPILEHLGELRGRLVKISAALLLLTSISFIGADWMLAMLLKPFSFGELTLTSLEPAGVLMQSFRLALTCGVVLSLPLLLYQAWKFVAPGLKEKEQKILLATLYVGTLLFAVGVFFAYFYVIPTALQFFWEYSEHLGVTPSWTIDHYLDFVLMFLMAFGFAFESPLVVLLLVHFGIVTPQTLRAKRPYVIVGIAIAAALLTPPDVGSQLMLGIPMWFLFEGALFATRFLYKSNRSE